MIDHIQPIGETLAAQRRQLGLTQSAVAKRAGIAQTYLSKIEHAKIDPRISTLLDIARAEGLELVLVPSEIVPAIRSMLGQQPDSRDRPLFGIERD